MTKSTLTWVSAGMIQCEDAEFGTKEDVEKIFSEFPDEYISYEGGGQIRDRKQHCNINVHVFSVPGGNMGYRLLAYPKQNY